MNLKVSMIIMSHLSDAQALNGSIKIGRIHIHLNFVKYLVLKYPNTDVEIDADEEYNEFLEKHPSSFHIKGY